MYGRDAPKPGRDENRLRVRLSPEDLLRHPYLVNGEKAEMPADSGTTIEDAIRKIAWKLICLHAPPRTQTMTQKKEWTI